MPVGGGGNRRAGDGVLKAYWQRPCQARRPKWVSEMARRQDYTEQNEWVCAACLPAHELPRSRMD